MNKKVLVFILILSFVFIALSAAVAGGLTIRDFSVNAEHAFAYDVDNEEFLYLKGENEIIYPASTTKLLTALFALECAEPDTVFRPGDELQLVGSGSSIAYIKPIHQLTLEMLIEGMLLPSGNDAAYVIAAGVGRILADDETLEGKTAVDLFME